MNKGDRVRFLEWSDNEGPSCVYPLVPGDLGTITEVVTDPAQMPGVSPDSPMYEVTYRKGNGYCPTAFKIVHFEEEIELVLAPELEEVLG